MSTDWKSLLGHTLVDKNGSKVNTSQLASKDYVMIYLSATYCKFCGPFTTHLTAAYQKLKQQNASVEVVLAMAFDPKDPSEETYMAKRSPMPFLSVPFKHTQQITKDLRARYGIKTFPNVIVLDKQRKLVNVNARTDIENDPQVSNFPWVDVGSDKEPITSCIALDEELENTPMVATMGMGSQLNKIILDEASKYRGKGGMEADEESGLLNSQAKRFYTSYPEMDTKYTFRLVMAIAIAVLSAFQVGMGTGLLNVPAELIKAELIAPDKVSDEAWSIIVSIFAVGGLFGSYFAGGVADTYGRRVFILVNNFVLIAGTLLQCLATAVWMMVLGRFLLGFACGSITVVIPLYLGEVSPAHLRGTVGAMVQLFMTFGLLASVLIGQPLMHQWRYLVGSPLVLSALQLMLAPLMPESPRWLVAMCRHAEAEELLCSLRAHCEIRFAEATIQSCVPLTDRKGPTVFGLLGQCSRLSKPLMIAIAIQLGQQFSGINAVFYYSTSFFTQAGISDPWMGSVLACGINVVGTLVAVFIIDRAGRRLLLIASSFGMALSAVGLTIVLYLNHPGAPSYMGNLAVVNILAFVFFFELGLGPVTWLITAEVFPPEWTSSAITLASTINWICNFIVGVTFPFINTALGRMAFVPFGVCCVIVGMFVLLVVPETKGKTLAEIQKMLGVKKD